MSENNKDLVQMTEIEEQDHICDTSEDCCPEDDLQVVMKGGVPVSVILSVEEFDRMTNTIAVAEELLEGKDLFMPDGTKVTFKEMVDQRIESEQAQYEADLASMLEEEFDEEDEESEEEGL